MNKIIEVKNVNYTVEGNHILKDISFTVDRGDFIGIIGPNGSGKTSLVKLVLGINEISSGDIIIDEAILRAKKMSFVSQQVYSEYKQFPVTVFEVVRMGLYVEKGTFKFFNKADDERVMKMLEKLNIAHLANSQITRLSGGERQRALLGRSLISEPEVIILDEPTSALDPEFREQFYKLIEEINVSGITVIIISHDLGVLESFVNKILYIDHQVEYFGSTANYNQSKIYEEVHGDII